MDVKPAAKALIEKFGSLDNVFSADVSQLETVPGIGRNSAILISLVHDLQKRCAKSKNSKVTRLGNADDAEEYFMNLLGSEELEKFVMVTLDNSNRIVASRILAAGSTKHLKVYSRDVVQYALFDFTLDLRNTLNAVDIELADHIIVGGDGAKSMRSCPTFRNFFTK